MKTYTIASQVRTHIKVFNIDWYTAIKVQQYYRYHGRKVSITRLSPNKHALQLIDILSMVSALFVKE
jgi:hypothetical protein